jgi:hypothetical protein
VQHPIDSIQWIETDYLDANDYNPNVVARDEFRLLKLSLLKQGWIQPILVARAPLHDAEGNAQNRFVIIDGFHRSTLAREDADIIAAFGTKVPCTVLDITEAERKMLTVRINRAKGSHVATKMHDLVTSLHVEHEVPIPTLMAELGASKGEIELLLHENVFKKMEIETFPYSRAWVPHPPKAKRASA